MMEPQADSLAQALTAYQAGNPGHADVLCRAMIEAGHTMAILHLLRARIALDLGMPAIALEQCQRALEINPDYVPAQQLRQTAESLPPQELHVDVRPDRFLYIKSWGFGFWSDVDHAISQLLIAELSGRRPIVHWGLNSMFRDANSPNGFIDYFERVSDITFRDVVNPDYSYWPPKWNYHNLQQPEIDKWSGPWSRLSSINFLNRDENVLVSDFHTYLSDLTPWIPPGHVLYGMPAADLYRHLYSKYLHLKPHLAGVVEQFWADHLAGKKTLAVHLRGSDKITESAELETMHTGYYPIIDQYLLEGKVSHLFLLTDSIPLLDSMLARYGDRIITTQCHRSVDHTGVHHHPVQERSTLAREIILDAYLAARCDHFLGIGDSNVSTAIHHLRDPAAGEVTLLGRNHLYTLHSFLFDRQGE